ncbi:AP-4 complex accessory subunit tepsin [Poecilia reticulata]|uniref:TEPSIN adaptor related protein complex 4 accessory protein n=1 Tax=Poecilia reticulata TaxID=8081 RepID=A0A3P9Q520_POERE|nr:PREDICTED: AP-4 complex accessory subunit tepsin [Poecilia reticulata]
MAAFMERLSFLQKIPTLMKATADDETPCPGYLFQEIGKICHESSGYGQCLLEYLLERLQVESCHVKLKVLKIFIHLCGHGSKHFLTELRRNSTFIQQASTYSGAPDPVHGTALYQRVRSAAQEVARLLFTDTVSTKDSIAPHTTGPTSVGMGSAGSQRSGLQGFGYSPGTQGTGSDTLLDKIHKAAEVVASAVLPPTEHQGIRLHENHYRAVVAPSAPIEVAVAACAYNLPTHRSKASQRCPGQVGGGWEETDSSNGSSHNSSQDMAANSRASAGSKSAGSRSQSGASRESNGDPSERTEALQLGDCGQEMALISRLTEGSKVFLTREESQHFLKECSTLNCEVVVELLSSKLQDLSYTVKMRALCAIACLMTSDLLALEQTFRATQLRLCQLSEGPPGPVANKATKILRQFEALMGGPQQATRQNAAQSSHQATSNQCHPAAHLESSEATNSADTFSGPNESELSSSIIQPQNLLSSSSSLDETWRCSTLEQLDDLTSNKVESVRTAGDPELIDKESPSLTSKPESAPANQSSLSLFSGMELVTRGYGRGIPHAESNKTDESSSVTQTGLNAECSQNSSMVWIENTEEEPSGCRPVSSAPEPVSVFSFLNS